MNQLLPYFEEHQSEAANLVQNEKNKDIIDRITVEFSDKIDNLENSRDRRRADHYWTRKRGRDTTTRNYNYYPSYYNYPYQYSGQPTQFGFPSQFYYLRGKRAVPVEEKRELKPVEEKELSTGDKADGLRRRGNPDQDRKRGGPPAIGMGGGFKRSM